MRECLLILTPLPAPGHQIWEEYGKYSLAPILLRRQIVNYVDIVPVHFSVHQCVRANPTVMPTTMNHQNAMRSMLLA